MQGFQRHISRPCTAQLKSGLLPRGKLGHRRVYQKIGAAEEGGVVNASDADVDPSVKVDCADADPVVSIAATSRLIPAPSAAGTSAAGMGTERSHPPRINPPPTKTAEPSFRNRLTTIRLCGNLGCLQGVSYGGADHNFL